MGKKPILVIFASVFLVVSYVQFRLDVRSANLKGFEILMVQRERSIRVIDGIATSLVATGRLDAIEGHLKDAIRVGWIDFFILTYDGEVMAYESLHPLSSAAYTALTEIHPGDAFSEFHEGSEDFRFFESELGGKRRLKLGFSTNREQFLREMQAERSVEDHRIFILSLIVALGVFIYSARDLIRVAKILSQKGVRGLKELNVKSKEAAILQQGIGGYGEAVGRLEKENRTLSAQVLPSLRTELRSGKKPPYEFNCAMVRTDINNFTKIFHSYPADEFLATINLFFTECSHVISRYDGLIHEFVGDEIIYYFKDEQHENSFLIALSCAADIADVASRVHKEVAQRGYPFRIKSSISYGKIRFGPLLNGFGIAGSPLIESTRILSAVNERDENTIHFDSSNQCRLNENIFATEVFRVTLKGLDGERQILRYDGHRPLSDVLSLPMSTTVNGSLDEYRADNSLILLLATVRDDAGSSQAKQALDLFSKIRITACGPKYAEALVTTIRFLIEHASNRYLHEAKALAILVGALPRILPIQEFQLQLENLLIELSANTDPRVVANTIETLQSIRELGPSSRALDFRLVDAANSRVAANALVFLGTNEITQDVVRRVRRFLDSSEVERVASGIYAWGAIAKHHLETDPVHYRTQIEFVALGARIESIASKTPSLLIQAIDAAQKAGESELLQRLEARACA